MFEEVKPRKSTVRPVRTWEVKSGDGDKSGVERVGTVINVIDRGYGFIKSDGIKDVFFFRSVLGEGLEFGGKLIGRRVKFTTEMSERGIRANRVWAD